MGMRAHVTSTRSRAERPQRVCIYTYAVTYTCPVAELYRTGSSASVRSIPAGRRAVREYCTMDLFSPLMFPVTVAGFASVALVGLWLWKRQNGSKSAVEGGESCDSPH